MGTELILTDMTNLIDTFAAMQKHKNLSIDKISYYEYRVVHKGWW
jgi:hypothetical protein